MSRPLSGHLDDVDLDEVLRVVALSRRSGILDVDASDGEVRAELHFVAGRLVRARLHHSGETVGQVLVRVGVLHEHDLSQPLTSETLEELVARAERERGEDHLLVRVDDVIAEQLDDAVSRVLQLRQGSFSFRVTHEERAPLRYPGDTAFTLPSGVDAEELARDAKRRRHERKNDPLAGLVPALPRQHRTGTTPNKEAVIVDDDPAFLASIERLLTDANVPVQTLSSARLALDKLPALLADGLRAVVVDLVMPHSNGRGILGGLEVLRAAARGGWADRIFLAFDDEHDDAAAIAASLGAAGVLLKPSSKETLPSFLDPVLGKLERPNLFATSSGFDLARELMNEMEADSDLGPDEWKSEWKTEGRARILDEGSKSLETLKALLGELNEPSFDEEIPLLILRFASAFFVRGALFSVDAAKEELVGLGGFGVGGNDPGRLVRSIRVPLHADTVFTRALAERCGVRQPLWDSEWNTRLLSTLGGPRPREVYTAPLLSPKGIEAVLYADNATEPRPFPDIALLEIFLQQSAAAMERAMLARQLKTLRESQPPQNV